MNNNKVLVSFDSNTMRLMVGTKIQDRGYEILYASDGLEALRIIYEERPLALVAYYDLPTISGFSLSRIIKNSQSIKDTSVIVCTTETSSVLDFWAHNSHSDVVFMLDEHNGDELALKTDEECKKVLEIYSKKDFTFPNEKDVLKSIVEAYEQELFRLCIIQDAFYTSGETLDLNKIIESMIVQIASVYNYDALGIIVNDEKIKEFYSHTPDISEKDIDDFIQICHSDFISNIKRKEYNWQNAITSIKGKRQKLSTEKIRSYECFPRDKTKVFPFTIHVATHKQEAFYTRTINRIDFFAEVYSILIEKALQFNQTISKEKKIRNAFERFVPEKIIDNILQGDNGLSASIGEKRMVAILIADIRSFTTISEINQPEDIVEFLNYYFTIMGAIIKKHGGTIDKFMGDAIMALFGAPESYEDNGNRAAKAAMEMMNALSSIDISKLKMPKNYNFGIGIGVHYGQPIVGSIGSQEKKEYTVIGDDVNITSRLEGLTKLYGSPIIISGSVKKDIENFSATHVNLDNYFLRHLDNVKVKGKSKPVAIYELSSEINKFSENFLENYKKALNQYSIGNFSNALEYFTKANNEYPKDKASKLLKERCKEFLLNKPQDWDGAVTLNTK